MSLNSRQKRAIPALLTAATIADAADQAGVTRRTVQRWLAEDPLFVRTLRAAQAQAIDDAVSKLSGDARAAAQTLAEIHKDPDQPAGVRVQAARSVLSMVFKMQEQRDLAQRLLDLEIILAEFKRED